MVAVAVAPGVAAGLAGSRDQRRDWIRRPTPAWSSAEWLPRGVRPVLMGDRFYGSPDLIAWCAERGSWRLRLKASLLVYDRNGGETTLGASPTSARQVARITSGHPEP